MNSLAARWSVLWNGLNHRGGDQLNSENRKSISSGDIFPKIIWEAQSGQKWRSWSSRTGPGQDLAQIWDLGAGVRWGSPGTAQIRDLARKWPVLAVLGGPWGVLAKMSRFDRLGVILRF